MQCVSVDVIGEAGHFLLVLVVAVAMLNFRDRWVRSAPSDREKKIHRHRTKLHHDDPRVSQSGHDLFDRHA